MTHARICTSFFTVVLLGLCGGPATAASGGPVMRRALVIAHNASDVPGQKALKYADDDGVQWAETLQRLGMEVTLLVDPDEETRASKSPVLASAQSPTLEVVTQAVARLREANQKDREAGTQTDVLVIYVGHGNTSKQGRASFTLADGHLDHGSLYSQVVDVLGADFVHLIVDACRAEEVVGAGELVPVSSPVVRELKEKLMREGNTVRWNTGALFAESQSGLTHEWSEIRAGIFSHMVRKGLLGAADVDGDGRVEYRELGTFVATALKDMKSLPEPMRVFTAFPMMAPRRPLVGPVPQEPRLPAPVGR